MRGTLLATLLALGLPRAARAEDAHDLFERGRSLARKGTYEEALELFARAAELGDNDAIELARGRVLFRLGRCRESSAAYDRAQSAPPADPSKRDELLAQLSQYRKDLSTCPGILDVECPDGAVVAIDGGVPRPCPIRSLTVASGLHEILVMGPDMELRRVVHVPAMESARIKAIPAKPESAPAPEVFAAAPGPPLTPPTLPPTEPTPVLAWSLSAATAGLLAAAVVLDAAVIPSAIDEFRGQPTLEAHDRAASWQLAGGAAYGAALVAGGCALVAWLVQ